jgi:hypothetical protein
MDSSLYLCVYLLSDVSFSTSDYVTEFLVNSDLETAS